MIDQTQIDAWKEEHGSVYKVTTADIDFYFRPLTREDYIEIMQLQAAGTQADPEVETVKKCILNNVPDSIYAKRGGVATVIYENIMIKSGFENAEVEEL